MSVAFRRESDEEHLEPKFERPIPPGPNLVTARGLALIADHIGRLSDESEQVSDAVRLAETVRDLRYWRARQASARLTEPPADGAAGFATRVRFRGGRREAVFDIVGQDEADETEGGVSFTSPVARALSGAFAGDEVTLPGALGQGVIVSVDPISH